MRILLIKLAELLVNEGDDSAWKFFESTSRKNDNVFSYSERRLNREGYALISLGLINEAIEVFKMNITLYPNSWNVYDSLGEAYKINGGKSLALENYRKSKQLGSENPDVDHILLELSK